MQEKKLFEKHGFVSKPELAKWIYGKGSGLFFREIDRQLELVPDSRRLSFAYSMAEFLRAQRELDEGLMMEITRMLRLLPETLRDGIFSQFCFLYPAGRRMDAGMLKSVNDEAEWNAGERKGAFVEFLVIRRMPIARSESAAEFRAELQRLSRELSEDANFLPPVALESVTTGMQGICGYTKGFFSDALDAGLLVRTVARIGGKPVEVFVKGLDHHLDATMGNVLAYEPEKNIAYSIEVDRGRITKASDNPIAIKGIDEGTREIGFYSHWHADLQKRFLEKMADSDGRKAA
jgi:hypothetical protein